MKKALALLSTLLLFLLPFSIATLDQTCRNATRIHADYIFCIKSFQGVRGIRTADTRGVAVIATRLLQANYASTIVKVKKLLKDKGSSPSMTKALGGCLHAYRPASRRVRMAMTKLIAFNFTDALVYMRAADRAPIDCAFAFYQFREKLPLSKENHYALRLGNIAWEIVALLEK